jgi:DNA-binding NtrC family response regulator
VAHVLLVDDHAEVLDVLARGCSARGHQAHLAATGVEAIEVGRRVRPAVAVLDFSLPFLSGPAAFAALLVELPNLHGYGISGVCDPEEGAVVAQAVGMLAFLSKPVRIADLLDLMEANLFKPRSGSGLDTNKQADKQTTQTGTAALVGLAAILGVSDAIARVRERNTAIWSRLSVGRFPFPVCGVM